MINIAKNKLHNSKACLGELIVIDACLYYFAADITDHSPESYFSLQYLTFCLLFFGFAGYKGLDWRGLTGSQSLELDHWIQIILWIG